MERWRQLREIRRGTIFKFRGIEWVLLGHIGGALAITKDVVCQRSFDVIHRNNYAESTIREYLNGEFAERIGAINDPGFLPFKLYLTADDGTSYGECTDKVFLLPQHVYEYYFRLMPPVKNWCWTATAQSALRKYDVYKISNKGVTYVGSVANGRGGVRPAVYLNELISVTIDGEEGDKND
ncbi:MAG: DUF6273 domain-containing protein [Lachnospiraceae bacterium]|nr:DUF6273 domain-containing protein [Lachnospiraceae bacterium]